MGRLFAKFLVGGIAGLLAWMICEPAAPKTLQSINWDAWARWEGTFTLILGALIGLAVGGLDGFTRGGKRHTSLGLGLGLLFGAIGIAFGQAVGGGLARAIFGRQIFLENYNILAQIPARLVAFIPIGLFLGAAIGGSSLTAKRTIQGAIGGAIGAGIAGITFDIVSSLLAPVILQVRGQTSGEVGGPARAIFAVLLGAGIGLFIGLVERFSRSAWLRLSLGRNEGKEWSIDTAQTFIGRSEGAQVPLFGDPNIAPIHASIQRQGSNYVLVDGGSPMGTYLNGQRIQQALLSHGSQIQIGGFVLQFLLKNQPAPVGFAETYGNRAYPLNPAPAGYQAPTPGYPTQMTPAPGPMANPMPGAPTQMMPGQPAMPMQPAPGGYPMPGQPTQVMPSYGANPSANLGGFVLLAIDGPMMGQRFPVGGGVEIGREASGVRMPMDANASRRHASVSPGVGGLSVQDLGSTNGTFVNGQRITQANVGPGDMVKVGSTTFRVEPA